MAKFCPSDESTEIRINVSVLPELDTSRKSNEKSEKTTQKKKKFDFGFTCIGNPRKSTDKLFTHKSQSSTYHT
jgi:hypothetical protein